MRTIWKYPIHLKLEQLVSMPKDSQILHFALQGYTPTIWVLVRPDVDTVPRTLIIQGTGAEPRPDIDRYNYIGTIQLHAFVWHLFDGGN